MTSSCRTSAVPFVGVERRVEKASAPFEGSRLPRRT